jgi:hypothetical protein
MLGRYRLGAGRTFTTHSRWVAFSAQRYTSPCEKCVLRNGLETEATARGGARVARVKRRAARGTAAAAAVGSAAAAAGGLPTGFVTSSKSPAPVASAASTSLAS